MKITKLKINSYGKLKDKEIELQDKINIIYGRNEAGKSTLLNFIVNSFYGISKNKRGKEYSNFEKYTPWIGEEFSGKLEYELDRQGKFEIYRDFRKKNPKVFNENGEDVSKNFNIDKSKGNEFFYEQTKVDEELFLSTLVVHQQEVKLEKTNQNMFIQKIANIVGTGEDNVSYKIAIDRINRRQLNEVGTQNSREKPINIVQREIEKQEREKEELLQYENFKYEIEENKNIINKEIEEIEQNISTLRDIKKQKEVERLEKEKIQVKENIKNENENKIKENIKKQEEISEKCKVEQHKKIKLINKYEIIIAIILVLVNIGLIFIDVPKILKIISISAIPLYFIVILIRKFVQNKQQKNEMEQERKIKEKFKLEIATLENEKKILEENNILIAKEIEEMKKCLNLMQPEGRFMEYARLSKLEDVNVEIEKLQNQINSKKIKLHTLDLDKQNIEPKLDNLSRLEEDLAKNIEQRDYLDNLNKSINLTKEMLNKAYDKMKNTVAPKFTNEMSKAIESITNGKYHNVRFNDETGLIVELEDGNYIDANKLSVGTIDQLYLSLRLSMIEELSEEKMPIILDEAFVYFDDKRLEKVLKYLIERFYDRQIIIFSCTNREEDILKELKITYNLVEL